MIARHVATGLMTVSSLVRVGAICNCVISALNDVNVEAGIITRPFNFLATIRCSATEHSPRATVHFSTLVEIPGMIS